MALRVGSVGDDVASVREMLAFLGFSVVGTVKDPKVFDDDFEEVVTAFQTDVGAYADGVVGPITLGMLEAAYQLRHKELASPIAAAASKLTVVREDVDVYGTGYDKVRLRSDVMQAFVAVRDTLHAHGAILTSSGGIRDLHAHVNANRSATSSHYSGRAHDLYIYSGMVDPKTDPYVVERLKPREYRVWARCDPKKAADGITVPQRSVANAVTYKNRVKGVTVSGLFLDLTALFAEHGFKPIRARAIFENGGGELGAEWWHFQWETGLIRGHTTFGSELLRIYSEATLKPTPPWAYRNHVWGENWN